LSRTDFEKSNPAFALLLSVARRAAAAEQYLVNASSRLVMADLSVFAQRPLAFFARYIRRRPLAHGGIALAMIVAAAAGVSSQYAMKLLVDLLSEGARAGGRIWLVLGLLTALLAADNLCWRLAGRIASATFALVTGDVRGDLFRHLTGHAPSYFADRLPGTQSSRVSATANAVYTMENMLAWNLLPPAMATAGAVGYLATVSPAMAGGLALVAGALAAGLFRLAVAGRPLQWAFATAAAAVDGEMVDVIGNMALVRAFGAIGREHRRFDAAVGAEIAARRRSLLYLERLRFWHALATIALTLGLLVWAILLWQAGAATAGDVVLVSTLGFGILHGTRDLAVALVNITEHLARLSEAIAALLLPHEVRDLPAAAPLAGPRGAVEFEGVRFAYPRGRRVFEGFSLRIAAGQRVGLVGESGGGKSTLFALLQRAYDVAGGRILIDGDDISRITQESLHAAIALVPQDISLFHRSILENIRYGRPEATDAEVMVAVAAARCRTFIDALPEGLATIVGERGVKLSGGQRQRIAIARAFLKDSPILLLDEATSALDSESEEAIRDALDRLMRGRTVIAIAHRLSTLRSFDRIVVLEAGRVIEDGPPDQLMADDGPYRDLVRKEMERLARQAASDLVQ
jgi:ATP-binding cassette subfamily B protein